MTNRDYLRDLAKRMLNLAHTEENRRKAALWYAHNQGACTVPVVVMEDLTFEGELLPPLRCTDPLERQLELELQRNLTGAACIGDDKVVPDVFRLEFSPEIKAFSLDIPRTYASSIGYGQVHPIVDLEEDWHKLKPSSFSFDRAAFQEKRHRTEELLGDILPVVPENTSLRWYTAVSSKVVDLMGMETMLVSFYDCPQLMHKLYQFIADDIKACLVWQEQEGLLTPNNGNHYAGSGSYGFSRELCTPEQGVTTAQLWGNLNSQETVGISPEMYREFVFPYYKQLAECFGLVYYGCCEPVDPIWPDSISQLPHLRKVSISPWCNEEFMGEVLRDSGIIYCRKPSPNFVGVGTQLDEDVFTAHIEKSLRAAKDCAMEIVFRDIYSLGGNLQKPARAVALVRQAIGRVWG